MSGNTSIFKTFLPYSFKRSKPSPSTQPGDDEGQATKSSNPLKDAYSRRRRQVKQAQTHYRERNRNYTKSLEEEVRRLRELRSANEERQEAELENQTLKDLMTSNNIPLPESIGRESEPASSGAMLSLLGPPGPGQFLQTRAPVDDPNHQTAFPAGGSLGNEVDGGFNTSPEGRIGDNPHIDTELAGFDFVLMLEQPCLAHTGHPSVQMMPDQPSGHTLTLQAASLAYAPTSPAQQDATWTVPTMELERLLELSSNLYLVNELTPIQAWDRIRKHPKFPELTQTRLQNLAGKLLYEIQCHGFGGVMEETAFTSLLAECFPLAPTR